MKIGNKFRLLPIGSALLLFILGIIISAIAGFANEITLLLILGLGVLAIGVARLVYGWFARKEKDSIPNFVLGGLDVVWGIIALALITTTGLFSIIFGIWLLTAGVVEIAMSVKYMVDRSPFAGIIIDGGINLIFGVMLFVHNFNNLSELYLLTAAYLFVNTFTSLLVTVLASNGESQNVAQDKKEEETSAPKTTVAGGTTQVIIIKEDTKKRVAPKTKDATDIVADMVKQKEKKVADKQKAAAKRAKAKKAAAKALGGATVSKKAAPKKSSEAPKDE